MLCTRSLIILFVSSGVLCDGGSLLTPCGRDDPDCLQKSTAKFLENTANGLPAYDIRRIDPLSIPSLDYDLDNGLILHYKNLTVKGLKDQELSQFRIDINEKGVKFQTKANLTAEGEIVIEINKTGRSFSGPFSIKGIALGTMRYGYGISTDDKGVQHFVVGPETISCQAVGEPDVQLNSELKKAIAEGTEVNKGEDYKTKCLEMRQKILCSIVDEAYVSVVHNIRASAKILPKEAFLTGV
ncbi:juvenile hormone-binding protein-like isoform X2 [Leptidea sinapis]|uniref:juvenile hormone-binding protein-like isoform X2 n=1 Tax=Leptidea sinapis TaxID=189913 RepID=UPI0021219047|nr:juvenile hormone-binding protein-like isoform X2 [Leptidea sinapis]